MSYQITESILRNELSTALAAPRRIVHGIGISQQPPTFQGSSRSRLLKTLSAWTIVPIRKIAQRMEFPTAVELTPDFKYVCNAKTKLIPVPNAKMATPITRCRVVLMLSSIERFTVSTLRQVTGKFHDNA